MVGSLHSFFFVLIHHRTPPAPFCFETDANKVDINIHAHGAFYEWILYVYICSVDKVKAHAAYSGNDDRVWESNKSFNVVTMETSRFREGIARIKESDTLYNPLCSLPLLFCSAISFPCNQTTHPRSFFLSLSLSLFLFVTPPSDTVLLRGDTLWLCFIVRILTLDISCIYVYIREQDDDASYTRKSSILSEKSILTLCRQIYSEGFSLLLSLGTLKGSIKNFDDRVVLVPQWCVVFGYKVEVRFEIYL